MSWRAVGRVFAYSSVTELQWNFHLLKIQDASYNSLETAKYLTGSVLTKEKVLQKQLAIMFAPHGPTKYISYPTESWSHWRDKFWEFCLSILHDTRHTAMSYYTQTFGIGEGAASELIVGCNSRNIALQWLQDSVSFINVMLVLAKLFASALTRRIRLPCCLFGGRRVGGYKLAS